MNFSTYSIVRRMLKSFSRKEEIYLALLIITALFSGYFSYKNVSEYGLSFLGWKSKEIEIFSEGLVGEVKRLNPVFVDLNQVDRDISSFLFSGLTKYDPKQKRFEHDMAEHNLSEDKKTYRFVLKENLYWHDNTLVTADDVYFTYHDVIQHPDFQNPVLKSNFEKVKISKVDNRTIDFTLENPNSFFYSNTTVGILPKHILKDIPVADLIKDSYNISPIGTGPYKIDSESTIVNDSSYQIILSRFDKYYGYKNNIKKMRFTTYSNFETLLKSRSILDGISRISDEQYLQMFREDKKFSLYKYSLFRYTAAFFNMKSQILSNKKVRLALYKSINKDELMKKLQHKKRIDTPFLELNQEDWIMKPNIDEAKGALFDSGWKYADPSDTIRYNAQKKPLSLTLIARNFQDSKEKNDEVALVVNFFKEIWKSIGIDLSIEFLEESLLIDRILKKDYDILLYGHDLGYNFDVYTYWHSTSTGKDGLNLSNFTSIKADNLIESLRNLFDKEDDKKKKSKLLKLQDEIQNEVPALFLYSPYYYYAVRTDIANISLEGLVFHADRFLGMHEWQK